MIRLSASPLLPALVLVAFATPAQSASRAAFQPPPGLYRVDMIGTIETGAGRFEQRTDGGSGAVVANIADHEGHQARRDFPGEAPITHCIRPSAPPPGAELCRLSVGDADHGAARCADDSVSLAWRRIDDRTWEVDIDQNGAVAAHGDVDNAGMQDIAARIARHDTPEAQAKVREAMRQLPQLQRQAAQARADLQAKMQEALRTASPEEAAQIRSAQQAMTDGAPPMHFHAVQRLTRLSDSCD